MSASQILEFYQKHGHQIFSRPRRLPGWLFKPKYKSEPLTAAPKETFEERTLNDLKVPVRITSYEMVEGYTRVFKDNHHQSLHWGGDQLIWKVAAASSAAPVYFPAMRIDTNDSHVDGGVWANNPVIAGITEAVKFFGAPLENIAVLSLGTGSRSVRLKPGEVEHFGIVCWAWDVKMLNVVMKAQSKGAHNTACMLLRDGNYLRIDADLDQPIPLDDYETAQALIEREQHVGRINKNKIEALFMND